MIDETAIWKRFEAMCTRLERLAQTGRRAPPDKTISTDFEIRAL